MPSLESDAFQCSRFDRAKMRRSLSSFMTTATASAATLLLVAAGFFSAAAVAADPLREGVTDAARKILAVMRQQDADSISILGVEDTTGNGVAVGPGLETMLKDSLGDAFKPRGGKVNVRMRVRTPANDTAGLTMRVDFELTNNRGDDLSSVEGVFRREVIPMDIGSPAMILTGFGKTGEVAPVAEGGNALQGGVLTPEAFDNAKGIITGGNAARLNEWSPYAVRILSPNGQPLPLEVTAEGYPFVDLPTNARFMVEVVNEDSAPIATTVSLDGLNTFYKSRAPSRHSDSYIIPGVVQENLRRGSVIKGWWLDNGRVDSFLATTFENSERRSAGFDRSLIGAISVVISTAMPKDAKVDRQILREERTRTYTVTKQIPETKTRSVNITKFKTEIRTSDDGLERSVHVPYTETVEQTYTVMVPHAEEKTSTYTVAVVQEKYIGSGGEIDVRKVPTSDLVVGRPIGVISIRYRDPSFQATR